MAKMTKEILDWLEFMTPEYEVSPKGGRPRVKKRMVLLGIFWILDNGAKWKDLPNEYGSRSTVHRYFKEWSRSGVMKEILEMAAVQVNSTGGYSTVECFIDGTFAKAKGGGDGIGKTKAGKGVKIMLMVDSNGLPMAIESCSATPHESRLVQLLFHNMLMCNPPEHLIGDKAYDCDELDRELELRDVEMIAPHRKNRKPENKTQDGRALRRYKRRWKVERTISWLQNLRRLCIRWEKSQALFQGMLHFASCLLLLSSVLG